MGNYGEVAKEKEVVGVYISGHPLDDFRIEMSTFCNANVSLFSNLNNYINRELVFAGVLTDVQHRVSKKVLDGQLLLLKIIMTVMSLNF